MLTRIIIIIIVSLHHFYSTEFTYQSIPAYIYEKYTQKKGAGLLLCI